MLLGPSTSELLKISDPIDVDTTVPTQPNYVYGLIGTGVDATVVTVRNIGAAALTTFDLELRGSPNSQWLSVASTTDDFTNAPSGSTIRYSSGDPTTLAANGEVSFRVRELTGWYQIGFLMVAAAETQIEITVCGGGVSSNG